MNLEDQFHPLSAMQLDKPTCTSDHITPHLMMDKQVRTEIFAFKRIKAG
jgi:hypothetical protein